MKTDSKLRRACCNRRDFLRSACRTAAALAFAGPAAQSLWAGEGGRPAKRNIVLILSDDHRYDFMGFMKDSPAFLETPNMDRMAQQGAHLANAFVSTSLCSPSRASILTGQYMHHHRIVDNQRPEPKGTMFFPQYLQKAGYQTAFVGKWHMGHEHDSPRPGFDHWASFKGQGAYFNPTLNINNRRRTFQGYTTDVLTDQALTWLKKGRDARKPFFLYLSFKAVHYPFQPADRHRGRYAKAEVKRPETMANTERNYQTQPHWVRERRYSIHGVDHMETGQYDNDPVPSFDELYKQYCETVHGLDENLGRVLKYLDETGLSESTLVLYMGDNGFELGEHGFYDKRDAFEESIRVPMLAYAPGLIEPGTKVTQMVQNIDIAPTLLATAGIQPPETAGMDGYSFLPLLRGKSIRWRDHILYEYYWEWNFPATPTVFAIRTDRYKYIFYQGVWDHDGFYDLQTDPHERHNLINIPAYGEQIEAMKKQLFDELEAGGGLDIPVRRPLGERLDQRKNRR
ncbi:MAG TPA: acetylglucosamine-6-sulfatase [Phycisphaerales bacterium]|nr:acetylglucosamine-6-sulfatase [Phycisphaerales bacterium]